MNEAMRLGQAAIQNKKLPEALRWFSQAAKESPKDPQVLACLGQTLCWQGQLGEGLKHLRQSGQLLAKKARKTRDVKLLVDLADQLQHWNDYSGSVELCRQAVQINPSFVRGYQLLALSHSRLNQKRPALLAGKQALKLVPDSAMLSILVATLEINAGQTEAGRQHLEKVLQNPLLTPEEKFRAHKELARAFDKLGIYELVFPHLHAAGEVSPRLPEVQRQDKNMVPTMLDIYKTEFDAELLDRWASAEFPNELPAPVFVLGFMRTGTTLTQEVLGAHSEVFVADETDLVMAMANELKRISNHKGSIPEMLRQLDLSGVLHLRDFYWQRAKSLFGDQFGSKLFLDKTTMNSIDIGLINCIFPDAKLIFLLRDPRDVCLSCFMQTMIPTPSTVQLLNWENTARFYAQIMDWWETIKPKLSMKFTELRYEDAVFEFEPTFRALFHFLGLEWDPKVVDFHEHATGKFIASPSFSQVAQPLYSSSVGRWKCYEAEYSAIAEIIQPAIDTYAY
ncbi:MAG: tetratricopeptide repeat-containing sulfotransferase family protein [Gammaproteobacteria bacterium]